MSVNYVDIGDLSQKSAVAGTEKLPVSDTEYITPAQIGADYLPLSGGTMSGNITMPNNKAIRMLDSGGTARGVAHLGSTNLLQFGYDTAGVGYDTRVSGNSVSLRYGPNHTEGLTLNSSGNIEVAGDIKMTDGEYINASNGYAMLGQNGSGTFFCGPGYAVSTNFLLRSANINLIHRKHTANSTYTDYKIYDASNITISSSDPTSSQGEDGDIWIKI